MIGGAVLYIVRCVDGRYYTGTARSGLEQRIAEHNAGAYDGYTARRRPVTLVFSQSFERITDAIAAERQVKGGRERKKWRSSEVISITCGCLRDAEIAQHREERSQVAHSLYGEERVSERGPILRDGRFAASSG